LRVAGRAIGISDPLRAKPAARHCGGRSGLLAVHAQGLMLHSISNLM
jgi:hypothetical protein